MKRKKKKSNKEENRKKNNQSPKKIGDNAVVIKGATNARVKAFAIEIIEIE